MSKYSISAKYYTFYFSLQMCTETQIYVKTSQKFIAEMNNLLIFLT